MVNTRYFHALFIEGEVSFSRENDERLALHAIYFPFFQICPALHEALRSNKCCT